MRAAAGGVAVFLLWCGAEMLCRALPLPLALPAMAGLCAAYLACYVARARRRPRIGATLRLRWPGPHLPWVLAATPAVFLFGESLSQLYSRLPFVEQEPVSASDAYVGSPGGVLLMLLATVVFTPLLEEFTFRGMVQRRLERRYGTAAAIALSTLLFTVVHGHPSWFPVVAVLGALLGLCVAVTRSIWTGVLLHAGFNAAVLAVKVVNRAAGRPLSAGVDFGDLGPLWVLFLSGSLLVLLGRGIHRASRSGPRRTPFAAGRAVGWRARVRAGTPGAVLIPRG